MPQAAPPLRYAQSHPQGPAAALTRRAADRLRAGSVWVYRSEVEQLQPAPGQSAIAPGALVTLLDSRGIPLGSALFSDASQITFRLVSTQPALSRPAYLAEVAERTRQALDLRHALAPVSAANDACRLIFSEADRLPGIVADRYKDLVVLQLLTQGTAQDDLRAVLAQVLAERLGPATILERPDPRIRIAEQIGPSPDAPLYRAPAQPGEPAEPKLQTTFTINGMRFAYDASSGQKTGAFLDQRLNYAAAAGYARGKALDVCTYQGGFALHLARACAQVTGVDASRAALEVADANVLLNLELAPANIAWIEADAFDLLREYESTGCRFDTIVLDPPAFAKSSRATEGALRGYKELNLRALKMLSPGGTLVTCSCSQHVSLPDFTAILAAAAADAGRRVQVLETRGAAPDHPRHPHPARNQLPQMPYLPVGVAVVLRSIQPPWA